MAGEIPYVELKNHLLDHFSGAYPVLDFDQVDTELEQSEKPFLVLEEIVAEEEPLCIGDEINLTLRESGSMVVHCAVPSSEGSIASRRLADEVRDALRMRTLDQGVRVQAVSAPDPGELMQSGLWSVAALVLTYERDFSHSRVS